MCLKACIENRDPLYAHVRGLSAVQSKPFMRVQQRRRLSPFSFAFIGGRQRRKANHTLTRFKIRQQRQTTMLPLYSMILPTMPHKLTINQHTCMSYVFACSCSQVYGQKTTSIPVIKALQLSKIFVFLRVCLKLIFSEKKKILISIPPHKCYKYGLRVISHRQLSAQLLFLNALLPHDAALMPLFGAVLVFKRFFFITGQSKTNSQKDKIFR